MAIKDRHSPTGNDDAIGRICGPTARTVAPGQDFRVPHLVHGPPTSDDPTAASPQLRGPVIGTREIGIRAAIGATRGQILNLIIRQGLVRCGIGVLVGILGSLYLTRFLRSQLFDITSTDPIPYVGVSLLLLIVAGVASLIPALRASRVDPVDALRVE